jgi:hypothetical protein
MEDAARDGNYQNFSINFKAIPLIITYTIPDKYKLCFEWRAILKRKENIETEQNCAVAK